MRSTPITLEMLKTGNFYFLHTQLSEFWTTDIFEECERVGFHPWKHFPCHSSFLEEFISWGCTSSLFFLPLYHIYLYLITIIHFFQNRNGDQSQIQLSQDTLETFLETHRNAWIYAYIAHCTSLLILHTFLWFWLIMWDEFLGRVLDWNVKTNQWQIAWTHSNWHL